jgi:DNA polymerase-3 subunit alpha
MKYNLLFERFLNPERVSMPDFDIDIETERREEVVQYVTEKYGQERVSKIITFGTLAAKMSIQDVGKALEIPDAEIKRISDLVPLNVTLSDALKQIPEFAKEYEKPQSKMIIDTAMKLEGMPRHISSHAAGVLIADKDITEYAPLAVTSKGDVVIQFPMTTLEEIGLVKMDFLGLRTLNVIQKAEVAARKKDPDFSIENIPMDDKKTYELLSSGNTEMVFQFESGGMQSILKQLQPNCLEDIIAIISLYRPGPMDSIPEYIKNKHNPAGIKYADPKLEEILSVTYGVLVYQEQMMQLFRSLAGYSLGRADIVRRAMAKKKLKIMNEEKGYFVHGLKDKDGNVVIEGALARGVSEKVALELTDTMTSFASYAFNKSHAAAYAKVSYQTAYLLAHYPQEFAAAYITTMDEVNKFRKACNVTRGKALNITILPPDINKSQADFVAEGESVRYGLASLTNVNAAFIKSAVQERNTNGDYKSVADFINRNYCKELRAPVMDSLIKSGAFDFTGLTRATMLAAYPAVIESAKNRYAVLGNGLQYSVYELLTASDVDALLSSDSDDETETIEDDINTVLEGEFTAAKIYFSGHPLNNYRKTIDELGFYTIEALNELYDANRIDEIPKEVVLPVKLSACKRKMSKKKTPYMTMTIEDLTAPAEVTAFSKVLTKHSDSLVDNNILLVKCFVEVNDSGLSYNLNNVYHLPADNDSDNAIRIAELRKTIGKYLLKKKIQNVAVDVEKIAKKPPVLIVIAEGELTKEKYNIITETCKNHPGDSSVILGFINKGKKYRQNCDVRVNCSIELIKELTAIGCATQITDVK